MVLSKSEYPLKPAPSGEIRNAETNLIFVILDVQFGSFTNICKARFLRIADRGHVKCCAAADGNIVRKADILWQLTP
jgi:hypothetical protein